MTNYRKKLLWLYARKRGSGSGGISVSVSGTTPVTLANAIESAIRHMTQFGKLTQSGTPTTANPVDIVCNNGALKWDSENQRIYADGTPEVLTVSADDVADQTASVENLLAVGNVRDEQDIITGKVIRRTEAFVYDGTQTVKPTFMSTTGGKDDGAIIVQPRGAEYAGDVVSFEAEEGKHIDSLKVTLTPTQDLHGYDSPWPAGGGKNKVLLTAETIQKPDWYIGNWIGITLNTHNGITQTRGYSQSGAGGFTIILNAGTYTMSMTSDNGQSCRVGVYSYDGANMTTLLVNTLMSNEGTRYYASFDVPSGSVQIAVRPVVNSATSEYDLNDIQIEAGSTNTAFAPYSNRCPITGTEQAEVVRTGKNLLNDDISVYSSATNYLYLLDVVPKLSVARMTFVDKDTSVDVSGCYIGFCSNDVETQTSPSEYRWCVNNGNFGTVFENISPRDVRLGSVFVYPKTQATFDKLFSRWNIQVELGTVATPYEPYQSTTLEVEWGADVGTIYGGSVDAVRGEIVLNKASYTWDGSIPFTVQNNVFVNNKAGIRTRDASVVSDKIVISNMFKSGGVGYRSECTDGSIIKVRGANTQIACYSSAFASVDDFNAYLAQHPMTMVYDLAQPIHIPLDPQTLTALQMNTVWSDAGSVDVLLNDELVETVAKQPLRTAEGDNTVSVVSEVGEVELAVTYKGGSE